MEIITLITDFGNKDGYVGAMKGVMLDINPNLHIVDITHDISPQDIGEASFVLMTTFPFFPKGTIHLAVVDPGVGSLRRPLATKASDHIFVGPDNGIFGFLCHRGKKPEIYEITENRFFRHEISYTFHGRDLFAPVAAHLSLGLALNRVGKPISHIEEGTSFKPFVEEGFIQGEIIYVDRFGNLITNITKELVEKVAKGRDVEIRAGEKVILGISQFYSQEAPGEVLALFGSSSFMEISINMGNAAQKLKMGKGDKVIVEL